ncbi:MAG: hypothetical protein JXA20_17935 [Spirochaetes bacterium]|nr:hypothetical protein [Spirochaetota bacterium]
MLNDDENNITNDDNVCQVEKSIKELAINQQLTLCRFYTDGEMGYVQYEHNGHVESARITSKNYRRFIRRIFKEDYHKILSDFLVGEVISQLEAEAQFDGQKAIIYGRIGKVGDSIVLNPCWDSAKNIIISAGYWDIVDHVNHVEHVDKIPTPQQGTPLFLHPRGMLPLPFPEKGVGTLDDFRKFVSCQDDDHRFLLIISYIIQCMLWDGPFPILVILGEPGSGKTVATTAIKKIIDPHEAPTMSVPREERDLSTAAGVAWLLAYDNFSSVPQWLSDVFCRFSTGGSTISRQLFTDGEAYIFSAKRPTVVNGISDFFNQSDVLQRAIILDFKRIPPEQRRNENELWGEFEQLAPGILYDLLDIAAKVLELLPSVKVERPLRMADFCTVGTAVGVAMGYDEEEFMQAYSRNQQDANEVTLEASHIYPYIKKLLETGNFDGTPKELLNQLNSIAGDEARAKLWPKTPIVLSNHLRRLAPNLREAGIQIETGRNYQGRFIVLRKDPPPCPSMNKSSTCSTCSTLPPGEIVQRDPQKVVWGTL